MLTRYSRYTPALVAAALLAAGAVRAQASADSVRREVRAVRIEFDTLAHLEAVLAPHLVRLTEQLQRIRSLTLFHWWPLSRPPPV